MKKKLSFKDALDRTNKKFAKCFEKLANDSPEIKNKEADELVKRFDVDNYNS